MGPANTDLIAKIVAEIGRHSKAGVPFETLEERVLAVVGKAVTANAVRDEVWRLIEEGVIIFTQEDLLRLRRKKKTPVKEDR